MTPITPEERLVFFPCGSFTLAGILTIPSDAYGWTVVSHPWGSSTIPSSGPNRIRARLARTLADRGFHAFRFDYSGAGESDGDYPETVDMAKPRSEEIIAACDWLSSQDLPRVIVVANCFGGWSSLMAAPRIPGLEGMAVVNAPVRRDHQQVFVGDRSWRWWASKLRGLSWKKLRSRSRRALSKPRQGEDGFDRLVTIN